MHLLEKLLLMDLMSVTTSGVVVGLSDIALALIRQSDYCSSCTAVAALLGLVDLDTAELTGHLVHHQCVDTMVRESASSLRH